MAQFKRMAKAEFYAARAQGLEEEVRDLRERTSRKRQLDPRPPLQRPLKAKREAEARAKAATVSSGKPKPKGKAKAEEDEYTYEYCMESGESEEPTKDEIKSEEDTKGEPAEGKHPVEWKGGRGKFGLLKESNARAADPAKLNYLGGMRNPAEVVAGMPNAQNLGMRIFAAWERFTKSSLVAMETAANYGTVDCNLDEPTVERWRGEMRKLVGSRGKLKAALKSKWAYKSPIQEDIVSAWTSKAADPDTEVARWVSEGMPLGINIDIVDKGIFPPADKEAEQESKLDALAQMSRGTLSNYTSVQDNMEDAKEEVRRLENLGFLKRVTKEQVKSDFSQGTISRLALIVKERPDKTKKRRLIIDLRRSGGNAKARLGEKLVLPRASDAIKMMRTMVRLKPEVTKEEEQDRWRREMLLIDVSDAFPHLGVHHQELEHCLTPGWKRIPSSFSELYCSVTKPPPFFGVEQLPG
eukprot:s2680_g8.t1